MSIDVRTPPAPLGEPEKDIILLRQWCERFWRKYQQTIESLEAKIRDQADKINKLEAALVEVSEVSSE